MLCFISMRKQDKTIIIGLERLLIDLQAFHPQVRKRLVNSPRLPDVRVHGEGRWMSIRRAWVGDVITELGRILKVLRVRSVLCTLTERQRLAGRLRSLRSEVRRLKGWQDVAYSMSSVAHLSPRHDREEL